MTFGKTLIMLEDNSSKSNLLSKMAQQLTQKIIRMLVALLNYDVSKLSWFLFEIIMVIKYTYVKIVSAM